MVIKYCVPGICACISGVLYAGTQATANRAPTITLNPAVVLVQLEKEQSLISTSKDMLDNLSADHRREKIDHAMGTRHVTNISDQIEYGANLLKRWYLGSANNKNNPIILPYVFPKGEDIYNGVTYQVKNDSNGKTPDGRVPVSIRVTNWTTFSLFKYTPHINYYKVNDGGNYLFNLYWNVYGFSQ